MASVTLRSAANTEPANSNNVRMRTVGCLANRIHLALNHLMDARPSLRHAGPLRTHCQRKRHPIVQECQSDNRRFFCKARSPEKSIASNLAHPLRTHARKGGPVVPSTSKDNEIPGTIIFDGAR